MIFAFEGAAQFLAHSGAAIIIIIIIIIGTNSFPPDFTLALLAGWMRRGGSD